MINHFCTIQYTLHHYLTRWTKNTPWREKRPFLRPLWKIIIITAESTFDFCILVIHMELNCLYEAPASFLHNYNIIHTANIYVLKKERIAPSSGLQKGAAQYETTLSFRLTCLSVFFFLLYYKTTLHLIIIAKYNIRRYKICCI